MAKRSYRKSDAEARIERITWGLLVLAFAIFELVPNVAAQLPNWAIPISGAVILLGSGAVQYARCWRVSPITWIAGAILLMFGLYNIYIDPSLNFLGLALIVFAAVIFFGVITNET